MKPTIPLAELGFDWQSHKAALGWWDCIFRRPQLFEAEGKALPAEVLRWSYLPLSVHGASYFVLLILAGRFLLADVFGLSLASKGMEVAYFDSVIVGSCYFGGTFLGLIIATYRSWWLGMFGALLASILVLLPALLSKSNNLSAIVFESTFGISLGIVLGLAGGIVLGIVVGLAFGIGFGGAVGIALGFTIGIREGIAFGIAFGIVFGIAAGIAVGTAGGIGAFGIVLGVVVGIAGGISFGSLVANAWRLVEGIVVGIAAAITFWVGYFRMFYLPSHLWAVARIGQGATYHSHPLLADHCILFPLPWLDTLLVAYHDAKPTAAAAEIERLIDTYPSQRNAALRAKAIVVARRAAQLGDLTQIDATLEVLPAGKKGFLAEAEAARQKAHEVTVAAQRLENSLRGYLRAPYAESLVDKIEIFRHQIAGFKQPLSTELRKAADDWQEIAHAKLTEAQKLVPGGQFQPVFRASETLDREVDAYLPRRGLLMDLENQVRLASASSGLVLIGRRRTGKSTLLANLGSLVEATADVTTISMQSPRAFTSIESLQELVREKLTEVLRTTELPEPGSDLRSFEAILAKADQLLEKKKRKLVLGIDEYENIDAKIASGAFPEDLLALLRESMREHRRIFWLFVGSRSSEDLKGAPWTSYFVSTRLLEMPLFDLEETRELLTEPMKSSSLFKDPAKRPRFALSFWGEGGIERLHEETAGWPHLVQLVAQNAVQLVNQEGRSGLDPELFERVCSKAGSEGSAVFTELLERESRLDGEWDYLYQFRRYEEQEPPADPQIDRSLRRRWLVRETEAGLYRLKVPLMRRWLRQRG